MPFFKEDTRSALHVRLSNRKRGGVVKKIPLRSIPDAFLNKIYLYPGNQKATVSYRSSIALPIFNIKPATGLFNVIGLPIIICLSRFVGLILTVQQNRTMMQAMTDFSEMTADILLLNRARQDPKAFDVLYCKYFPLLFNIAHKKLGVRPLAEDLVQEIFVALYQKLDVLEINCSLSAYLNKAIRFKIMNEYRSKAVRMQYSKTVFSIPICKTDFSELEVKELSYRLDRVYDRLPKKCRQVFTLSRKEGLSQKAISKKLDISLSTVEKHIGKALKIFKDELHEYRMLIQTIA